MAVVRQRREQSGDERRPHDRKLRGERIADWNNVGRLGERARGFGGDERKAHRLRTARRDEYAANEAIALDARIRCGRWRLERRECGRKAIVAVVAADFLDEIGLARDVDTEGWHRQFPARVGSGYRESET